MAGKKRLDMLVVDMGLAPSRQRAQALIMAGKILVNKTPLDKPGIKVSTDSRLTLKGGVMPYVSRGGLKLAEALKALDYSPKGMICMDVGASTGGFTDCLLQHGATKVYAVDVGYGQLAWTLRQDPRVVPIERTNIRHIAPARIPERIDLVTIDVSFISLKLVIPRVMDFLPTGGDILALIKPQFEVGKGKVGKGGVVREPEARLEAVDGLKAFFRQLGLQCGPVVPSPIRGPKGNQEFIILLTRSVPESS
jgi:23S rRNA (cytidine1920-2'-O)/16S rRNA (cytidine1409-2'-O)-methyltransferase